MENALYKYLFIIIIIIIILKNSLLPEVRVTIGQKPSMLNYVWNILESTGEMKLMMKFCLCLHKFSEL